MTTAIQNFMHSCVHYNFKKFSFDRFKLEQLHNYLSMVTCQPRFTTRYVNRCSVSKCPETPAFKCEPLLSVQISATVQSSWLYLSQSSVNVNHVCCSNASYCSALKCQPRLSVLTLESFRCPECLLSVKVSGFLCQVQGNMNNSTGNRSVLRYWSDHNSILTVVSAPGWIAQCSTDFITCQRLLDLHS